MPAGEPILQLKVSLVGITKPPVWRRVLVPAGIRLNRFHDVIQVAMGWTDSHLHAFEAGGVDYGPPGPELDHADERLAALGEVVSEPRDRMRYIYDFGDDWQHDIVLEKVLEPDHDARYPVCVAGKGRRPPEDCGGAWGYADLRAALADPAHEEHADMIEWVGIERGDEFDAEAFDAAEVNRVLGGRIGVA